MLKRWKTESNLKKVMDILGILIILSGIGVSIFMNTVGRSLWLDEAYLASSLVNRSIWKMTATPLDYIQSAPVIYLYIVKCFMILFGNSEAVLRIFSIIAYVLTIILSGYVSKVIFDCKYPILCAAFVANIDFVLYYSNVLKPYVSECVWVLLVFCIYYWYREKGLPWWGMALGYMALIWAANPVCFFIGGVLTCEFISGILEKKWNTVWHSVISGIGICGSFVVYYFYWLRAAATDDFMQKYWENDRFPFIKDKESFDLAWKLIRRLFKACHEELRYLLLILVVLALAAAIWKKNRYCQVAVCGFVLSLIASMLSMFPIRDRLWCFSFPLFGVLAFYALDVMLVRNGKKESEVFAVVIMLLLILTNTGISTYRHAENVYWNSNEANPLIAYVQQNVKEDEKVYVFYNSIPVVTYKNGYEVNRIGNVSTDNIIWGENVVADADTELVLATDKCYIISSQADDATIGGLLQNLQEAGTVDVIMDVYGTKLYYFVKN